MDLAISIIDWLALFAVIIAFIISMFHRDMKKLLPIQLYIIASLITNILLKILDFFPATDIFRNSKVAITNIYSLLEIALLYYFFYKTIKAKKFQRTMKFLFAIYLTFCLLLWSGNKIAFFSSTPDLYGIENIFILAPCFFYLYEILKSDLLTNFKTDSNFIITCGILFYFSITTPFFISFFIWKAIVPELIKIFTIMNLTFYTLLFISFMKAYLCPLPELKQ